MDLTAPELDESKRLIETKIRDAWRDVTTQIPDHSKGVIVGGNIPQVAPADDECDYCRKHFAGKSWEELSIEDVVRNFDCISYFDAEEIHGLLPAWLIASLSYPEENVYQWTTGTLGLRNREDGLALKRRCTQEQREAVRTLFQFFKEKYFEPEEENEILEIWS